MQQPQSTTNLAPQVRILLNHLQTQGSISQAEASTVYRIRALPRRISDLKEAGYNIRRELKKDATGQRYARYILVPEAETPPQPEVKPVLREGARVRITQVQLSGGYYKLGDEGIVMKHRTDSNEQFGDDLYVDFDNGNKDVYVYGVEVEVIA